MFRSPAQCATAHLQFLDELGAILRLTQARRTKLHLPERILCMLSRATVTWRGHITCAGLVRLTAHAAAQEGDVQLWGVHAGGLLDSLTCTDAVTAVAALAPEPYLVLGCRSGGLRVAALLDEAGAPADSAREAVSLSLLPYQGALGSCAFRHLYQPAQLSLRPWQLLLRHDPWLCACADILRRLCMRRQWRQWRCRAPAGLWWRLLRLSRAPTAAWSSSTQPRLRSCGTCGAHGSPVALHAPVSAKHLL